jgi:hypothetical protein
MLDLMDVLGIAGLLLFVYIVYEVCKVDDRMCKIGGLGLFLVFVAYIGRYVEIDRWTSAAVVVVAVGFVLLWLISR